MSNSLRRDLADLQERVGRLEQFLYGGGEGEAVNDQPAPEREGDEEPVGELTEQMSLQEKYGENVADLLFVAGYTSVEKVESASDEELRAIDGIGAATLSKIREVSDAQTTL